MAIESELHLVGAILIFVGGIIPAYLSLKLKGDMAKLTIALTTFVMVHGTYHIVQMQGLESIADGVFEPASVLVLIAFGVSYLRVSYKRKERRRMEHG